MIMEIISFDIPDGFDDVQIMEDARSVVNHWQANPNLLRKLMAKSDDGKIVGVYLWPDGDIARKAHDQAWIASFRQRTGISPHINYCKVFMVIDNENGSVKEYKL